MSIKLKNPYSIEINIMSNLTQMYKRCFVGYMIHFKVDLWGDIFKTLLHLSSIRPEADMARYLVD